MKNGLLQQATRFYQNWRRKQLWYRMVSGMACVVVFCTVYALILPAITMEKEPGCGLEEHTHTEACYTVETVWPSTEYLCGEDPAGHVHDEDCCDEDGNLICGYADFVVHTHDKSCYDRNGDLVCPLEEIEEHRHDENCYSTTEVLTCGEEETGHVHDQSCYTRVRGDMTCGLEESKGHTHGSGCYETERDLVCELEEGEDHTHDESCYETREILTCELEESEGHTHGDDCYDWTEELTCGREEAEGHIHDGSCYTTVRELVCDEEEVTLHTHDESCYDTEDCPLCAEEDPTEHEHPLICGKVQVLEHQHDETCAVEPEGEPEEMQVLTCGLEEHTHTDTCYEPQIQQPAEEEPDYLCGLEEHTHGEDCYDEAGELTCGLEEHVHDETCMAPAEAPQRVLTYTGADYTVSVSFGEDAALPEGVTLSAEEIAPDSEAYQTYYQQTQDTLAAQQAEGTEQVLFARFFDVQFLLDGQVVEPAAPVSVTITYDEPVETGEDVSCQAIHFAEDGTELLDAEVEEDPESGATSFTHTQESFSVVGSLVTRPLANPTDVGPDSLPVDYYVCIDGEWTRVGATRTGWYAPADASGWTDYNRDYITVEQAESILRPYGFDASAENPARKVAYQQKTINTNLFSDTNTVVIGENRVIPLARNTNGFNLYYLPANENELKSVASPEKLDKAANGFYTVTVSGLGGEELRSELVLSGGSFTYNASASGVTSWLAAYDNGTIQTINGSTIDLSDITSTVHVSPKQGDPDSHSVTFKVMIDGQWQEVGSLPYYYSGIAGSDDRAYITSDMAAQFFGKFGYEATEDPGKHFGYSYNDIYEIIYCDADSKAPTNYCMDVSGASYVDGSAIQLYTRNDTDAQRFRIRTAEQYGGSEGYKYLTPLRDSSRQVNLSGSGETNGQKLVLWTSPTIHSSWKVVPEDGGLVSFQLRENTAYSIDVKGNGAGDSVQLQIYQNAGAKFWKLVQHYCVSNDIVSSQNDDGTYNIGLTAESNGDIVCYYMPGETAHTYTDAAESDISAEGNSFWSVKVVDDSQGVYTVAEQEKMTQYVKSGEGAVVKVENANGVLWACRGVNGEPVEVTSTQDNGYTTFTITNITQPIEVTATRANPGFTVQYYANIPRFATSGNDSLKIIDTSADANGGKAKLPWNGGDMKTRSLYLEATGQNTGQNNGDATPLYRVATTTELTKMYEDGTFKFVESPGLNYFNKLKDNESYTLTEIWILKPGKDPNSTNRADWDIRAYTDSTDFTNEASQATGDTILINDGAVIRLVSDSSTGNYYNGTTFYDYNIASGKNTDGSWDTNEDGINSAGNYSGSGAKFAFGNQNCGVILKDQAFDDNTLNKANSKNASYNKATFELVTGLDGNGNLIYNSQIQVPKLFNEGNATGKQTYAGSSLTFDRVGDTYTLSAATLKNSNGQTNTIDELQYFFHPSPAPGRIWDGVNSGLSWQSNIFTNNFWPMDQAAGRTDGLWGTYGNPGSFYNTATSKVSTFPDGDDGRAHNWFFGMNFALNFTLTADYVGPLEYTFFGDDDLWVFLDGKLICDIGGVHSSIGEFVDLRDYLPEGSTGTHTLSFFYTERGASGSTCYMSFTLPSVSSATTAQDTGSLQITKSVEGTNGADFSGEEYQFQVELLTSEKGSGLKETFSYTVSDDDPSTSDTYGTVKNGGTIKLKAGQTATISGIPAGTFYRVTELTTEGYQTTVNGNAGYITSGTISNGGTKTAAFVNRPYTELPQTGGAGTTPYTAGGLLLMTAMAILLLYHHKGRRKEELTQS